MKKLAVLFFVLSSTIFSFAQDTIPASPIPMDTTVVNIPPPPAKRWNTANVGNRSSDHLLIQVGYAGWAQKPDSINTKGLSRSFNVYFMFDFPFKTNPHFSVAVGAGLSTSNIYFEKTYIDIAGKNADELMFTNVSDTNYFKKYKLVNTYAEAPVELRWLSDPYNSNKSWKIAIGGKIGTMLTAGTKGKNLLNKGGQTVLSYTQKEKGKRFFNGTRLSATARFGYGNFSLFGSYQLNSFVKEGMGPDVRPYMLGLTLSGL